MTLRAKLLLAQAPLLAALAFLGVLCLVTVASIGSSAQHILRDNYRSVLATQRMKEAIERMDSGALFVIAGQREKGMQQAAASRKRFAAELQVEEDNITERGEADAARRLHRKWEDYTRSFDTLAGLAEMEAARTHYFGTLEPEFVAVKDAADEILGMNQDAMVRKSERAQATAQHLGQVAAAAVVAALLLGILASTVLTARLLRPLSRLSQATHRIGEGDLDARAEVKGRDELAQLAADFNTMAGHLKRYRTSSLGELLQVQHAAQSAIDSIPDPVLIFDTEGGLLNVNHAAETLLHAEMAPGAAEPISKMEPAVREVLTRMRAHVLSGKGAYAPKDFSEAVCIKVADGEHYLLPRATPVLSLIHI